MKLTCELCVICQTVQLAASDRDFVIITAKVHIAMCIACAKFLNAKFLK